MKRKPNKNFKTLPAPSVLEIHPLEVVHKNRVDGSRLLRIKG